MSYLICPAILDRNQILIFSVILSQAKAVNWINTPSADWMMCYLQHDHLHSDKSTPYKQFTFSSKVRNMLINLMSVEQRCCCQTFDVNLIRLIWHSATGYVQQEVKFHNKDDAVEVISIQTINNRSLACDCGQSKTSIIYCP